MSWIKGFLRFLLIVMQIVFFWVNSDSRGIQYSIWNVEVHRKGFELITKFFMMPMRTGNPPECGALFARLLLIPLEIVVCILWFLAFPIWLIISFILPLPFGIVLNIILFATGIITEASVFLWDIIEVSLNVLLRAF